MEERKFLDLDIICDQIPNEDDRKMFSEAIRCYQIGSHRAAVILAWSVTADCLFRRIEELAAENDGSAQKARTALNDIAGTAKFEEVLIVQAKVCDLVDDYDEKCLRFARDTRSKCAHPTGVVPSAESVRHILHICSQIVLCRNGFRGISFIRDFVKTKLHDRHLFSNEQRIEADCKYFIEKVSERIRLHFGSEIAKYFDDSSPSWAGNALIFSKHLFSLSSPETAKKIAIKLQSIEGKNRLFFSTLVGLETRVSIWDEQEVNQSKAHLREALQKGKVDDCQFLAYSNLCALSALDSDDKLLLKSRLSVFSERISKYPLFQYKYAASLIDMVLDALSDTGTAREQVLKSLVVFSCLEDVFTELTIAKNDSFVDALIQENWQDENISNTWQSANTWSVPLQVALLKKTEYYLLECSEDTPDDLLVVFEVVESLIKRAPNLLPYEFESTFKKLIDHDLKPSWFEERGKAFRVFIGQFELLQARHSSMLTIIATLTLPTLPLESEDGEYEE